MASRVNVRFVVILGAVLLSLAAGVAMFAGRMIGRSAEASIAKGDKAAAEGDLRKAIGFYGRAVNKERRNVAYLNKWLSAMEKWVPPTLQAGVDAYQSEYVPALQALADAQRRDVPAFRRLLEEQYQRTARSGGQLAAWEGFAGFYDRVIQDFQGDQAGKAVLGRYRGLARLGMLGANPDLSPELLDGGLGDLQAALAADPKDSEVAIGLSGMEMAKAARLRAANDGPGADQLERTARQRLEALAQSDDLRAARARLFLTRREMEAQISTRELQSVVRAIRAQRPAIEAVADRLRTLPADRIESDVAVQTAQLMTAARDDGPEAGAALLEKIKEGKATDPEFLLGYARFQLNRGKTDEAIALCQQVAGLPDLPLGLKGLMLHQRRSDALRLQAEAAFARWDATREKDERDRMAEQMRATRKRMVEGLDESSSPVLAVDARLALVAGDLAGARTLATRYNDQTGRSDPQMLVLEGELLRRTGNSGAARQTLQRALEIDRSNVRALASMVELEAESSNFPEAARYAALASGLMPDNAALRERAQRLAEFASGTSDDPVLRCLKTARDQISGVGGDVAGAEATLEKCLKDNPGDARLVTTLIQVKIGLGKAQEAPGIVDAALAAKPDDPQLKRIRDALNVKDQTAAALEAINAANATELQKAIAKVQVFRQSGKAQEADAALDEAARLAPEDPAVIELLFGRAMMKNDQAEVARIVKIAETRNLDRVNGQLYQARAMVGRGALAEAGATLRAVLEKDKLNFGAWQLLGLVRMDQNQPREASEALGKALEIRPDDVQTIVAYVRALVADGKMGDALAAARRSELAAAGNADFTEMFLQLEALAPGGDREKAVAARKRLNGVLRIDTPQGRTNRAQLASLLINDGKLDEAEKIIDELRTSDPGDGVAVELKAGLIGRRGDVAGAVKIYREFIAGIPEDKRTPLPYINASRLLVELGQPGEALTLLGEGRKYQKPETMLIDRELGDRMFALQQYAGAADAYRRVLAGGGTDENNSVRKRVLECLLKSKDLEGFQKEYAALTPEQRDATTTLLASDAAVAANDRAEARRLLDQAVLQNPKDFKVYLKRADFNWDDPKMARDVEADLEQVLRLDPNSLLGLVKMSTWLRQNGRDDLAVARLRQALSVDPTNESLRLGTYQALVEIGRFEDAAKFMDESVQAFSGPSQNQWRIRAAQAWMQVGNWEKVVEHVTPLWAARKDVGLGVMYARALIKSGKPADLAAAFNVLNSAEVRAESGPEVRMLNAQLKAKQGQAVAAATEIAAVLAAINQNDRNEAAGFMEGLSDMYPKPADRVAALAKLESGRKFGGYVALLAAATRLREPSTKAQGIATLEDLANTTTDARLKGSTWEALGTLAYQDKDWELARQRFAKGLEADADNITLNNNMGFILGSKLKRGAEALPFAQKAVDAAPLNSGFRDTLGVAHLAAGNLKQAETELTKAMNLALNDTDRIPVYIHLGKLRLVQGDKLESRRLLSQARELAMKNEALRTSFESDLNELDEALNKP